MGRHKSIRLQFMNFQIGDELMDVFPGTGIMDLVVAQRGANEEAA